jgi:hypothetical protein
MARGRGSRYAEVEDQTARRCIACSSPNIELGGGKVRNARLAISLDVLKGGDFHGARNTVRSEYFPGFV